MKRPTLNVSFAWDSVAGIFLATLPNDASFAVARNEIGGKLENSLRLFQRACDHAAEGGYQPRKASGDFGAATDAALVEAAIAAGRLQRCGVNETSIRDREAISLEELGL